VSAFIFKAFCDAETDVVVVVGVVVVGVVVVGVVVVGVIGLPLTVVDGVELVDV
jgi:hypothetical protein